MFTGGTSWVLTHSQISPFNCIVFLETGQVSDLHDDMGMFDRVLEAYGPNLRAQGSLVSGRVAGNKAAVSKWRKDLESDIGPENRVWTCVLHDTRESPRGFGKGKDRVLCVRFVAIASFSFTASFPPFPAPRRMFTLVQCGAQKAASSFRGKLSNSEPPQLGSIWTWME